MGEEFRKRQFQRRNDREDVMSSWKRGQHFVGQVSWCRISYTRLKNEAGYRCRIVCCSEKEGNDSA